MPSTTLLLGDCAEQMRTLADNSIDAIVTDPPYGLAFMGANWDYGVPGEIFWREALRIAKSGAHLLAFGGTRTYHRLACAIEDAGWEIRDCIFWCYGSGFPKSMDVSKAIDKKFGQEREKFPNPLANKQTAQKGTLAHGDRNGNSYISPIPVSEEAKRWNGWGTTLKPACEPIVVARKPLEGTVAANVLKYGTGAINIDACRVPTESETISNHSRSAESAVSKGKYGDSTAQETHQTTGQQLGRFPANLIHDGSDEVLALFPDTGKSSGGGKHTKGIGENKSGNAYGTFSAGTPTETVGLGDSGSAARFFYCAKASRSERGEGNVHPTVKPLALMRYLVRLVTRKGGIVLDPFMGSGTTGVAALQEGMNFVGIERDPHYYDIASHRINSAPSSTPPSVPHLKTQDPDNSQPSSALTPVQQFLPL